MHMLVAPQQCGAYLEGLVVLNFCSSSSELLQAPIQHALLPRHVLILQLSHLQLQLLYLIPVLSC